jgi:GNAT superfamily N-acetyltransferase
MAVREIDIDECWDAALPLMAANWRETGCAFDFAPSREFFKTMQSVGLMFALGGYIENQLVGYAGVTLSPHPFNPSVKVASGNPLYVTPQYRGGQMGGRMMLMAEQIAQQRGARFAFWHMRSGTRNGDGLGTHGYLCVDNVWMKELA